MCEAFAIVVVTQSLLGLRVPLALGELYEL